MIDDDDDGAKLPRYLVCSNDGALSEDAIVSCQFADDLS